MTASASWVMRFLLREERVAATGAIFVLAGPPYSICSKSLWIGGYNGTHKYHG